MNSESQIDKIKEFIALKFKEESTGHDFFHLQRVVNLSLYLQKQEGGEVFLIESAAWLHDSYDYKLFEDPSLAQKEVEDFLVEMGLKKQTIQSIFQIIEEVSFRGGNAHPPTSKEAEIVQDADRLDAIGAIGVARAFAYGGSKGRLVYHPEIVPLRYENAEQYKNNSSPTLNHFYEKLFLLSKNMNTETAKKLAHQRHLFMEAFVEEFLQEWNFSS